MHRGRRGQDVTVYLVLPVFNEAVALGPLLERVEAVARAQSWPVRVIAVDDGSTDASSAVLLAHSGSVTVEVMVNATNVGLGSTIQRGLARASELSGADDVVVTMDADNTHPPELIPAMLRRLEQNLDLVIASRYESGARVVGLSPFRRLMTLGARAMFQLLLPVPGVQDYTCGFRAYRGSLLHRLHHLPGVKLAEETGFACMAEILLKCAAAGARVAEVPLELRYDLKGGPSKMNVSVTIVRLVALTWKHRRLVGHPPPEQ